ncbi:MAG: ATP-binding protein [Bacteroidia bacterium]|jgi:ATP-binding protein involved in chromosome partitioning|nr:Mrp/NBP35 family ATP-binding protein [Bacteroidales bacterium]NCD41468.1 ATP-binding protein [Bacteroidia bacterium]MDD2322611.1 Mrp/NBP35 family ATP-binding protein [Bacteroidales bacterium]MDD3010016.1 Mrp/NBP35 family ATP-binding protein [Bacteroidales bacterium]MDD3960957.1 Mrp/NBP35 family ATP-binding protein [Bacteroidales bacterium]
MNEPKHNPAKQTEKLLPEVKNIIAVASGKGGVGKSTVAANLAISLAKTGASVGLIDADIYGPSVPLMFDLVNVKPHIKDENGKQVIVPIEKYGIKVLSIGFFVDPDQALLWRGPMASGALTQLFRDAEWGALDYVVIDLPPGTGDIHLTLVQSLAVTGVVIVSTPQEVALADARKAFGMFKSKAIKVPILGLVENMAWFTPEELPENKYFIFGKEGGKKLAEESHVALLGQIPLVQGICDSGDVGKPIALETDHPVAKAFDELTENLLTQLSIRNTVLKPTVKVEINPNAEGCEHA